MPYLAEGQAEGEPLLRQNTGKQAGILKLVHYARRRFGDSLTLAGQDETAWRQLVQKVDGIVSHMSCLLVFAKGVMGPKDLA